MGCSIDRAAYGGPAAWLALAVMAVACTPGSAPPNESQHGGTLVVGLTADVDSWNPYTANEATSAGLLELLYPRLVRETGDGEFRPWLASSWAFSEDGLGVTFRLRGDARWSDGTVVTCEDVRFTHAAQTDDALAWPGVFIKDRIVEVACPDPRTVVFRFSEAYADQLLDANDDAIVPAAYGAVPFDRWSSTAWQDRFIGCGPYEVRSVEAGQEAVLERSTTWWGAEATAIERVVLRVFADGATLLPRLLDGDVDLMLSVPPLRAAEVEARPEVELKVLPSLAYTYLGWNALAPGAYREDRRRRGCSEERRCDETVDDIARLTVERPHPILADPAVRRALSLAIDRRDLVDGLYAGHAQPGSSPIPSALWAHRPAGDAAYAPGRAGALLDAAGWRDSDGDGVRDRNGRPFEIRAIVNSDNRLRNDALGRIAAGLERVGVRLIPESIPRGEFVARARDKDFDVIISGWWAGTRIEPQNLLHTRSALNRGNNLVAWSDVESDALLDRAAAAGRREDALPLWHAWQERFESQQPLAILYEERRLVGIRSHVQAGPLSYLNPFQNLHEWRLATGSAAGS